MGGGHDGWARPYISGQRDLLEDGVGCVQNVVLGLFGFALLVSLVMFVMWLTGYGHLLRKEPDSNSNREVHRPQTLVNTL